MLPNYRLPPDQLAKTQLNQVSSWCRYDPIQCVMQVLIETTFILLAYVSLLFLTGSALPAAANILKFVVTFVVLNIGGRMISDDLGNKLSITVISGIGSKCVSMLAPRIVGW